MMRKIDLKPINEGNVLTAFDLRLDDAQKLFVSHPMRSLALGYAYGARCHAFGLYDGNLMVGYVMIRFDENDTAVLWHFMIDREHQGKGCGKAALRSALDYIQTCSCTRRVLLTCHPANRAALGLYRSEGFAETGRTEGLEIELALEL